MNRVALLAALLAVSLNAFAQAWPAKPVRWVIPYPPGGSTDIAVRPVADRLAKALGQPIVIDNRTGAGGNIGTEFVAKSPADGYTVLAGVDSMASNPHVYAKLGYDTLKDFEPVTQLARQPVVLAAHPSVGVASVAELVKLARSRPGLAFATSGAGSQQHIAAQWFASLAGIKLTHVPYKGGGQAITDFVGGQVPLASLGSSPLIPHYKAGKVKLLAQSMKTRSPALPDVPTYEEAGYKVNIEQWLGVFVPAGTPKDIVSRLNTEIVKALSDPAIRERYAQAALEPVASTPAEFAKVVRDDYEKYRKVAKELEIRVE